MMDSMPVFVIKAKDLLALETISKYLSLCRDYGLEEQVTEVKKAMQEIASWQSRNKGLVKLPDHKHVAAGEES